MTMEKKVSCSNLPVYTASPLPMSSPVILFGLLSVTGGHDVKGEGGTGDARAWGNDDGPLGALYLIDSSSDISLSEHHGLRVLASENTHPTYNLWGVELKKALHDILYVIHGLHEKARILHRNISINNIAYRRRANGRVEGLVHDFDLALTGTVPTDANAAVASIQQHRTGTAAFMALHLLDNPTRRHRRSFDYESLFYTMRWLVANHERGGATIKEKPLTDWYAGDTESIRMTKRYSLECRTRILPHHKDLGCGLNSLRRLLREAMYKMIEGSRAHPEPEWDAVKRAQDEELARVEQRAEAKAKAEAKAETEAKAREEKTVDEEGAVGKEESAQDEEDGAKVKDEERVEHEKSVDHEDGAEDQKKADDEDAVDYELLAKRGITDESLHLTADGYSQVLGWKVVARRYELGEIGPLD
ncbi:hypothetical protein BOTBODRAFT_176427 [Botryobasidium botryosum FD-172 SS1]|uniref:Fungal-type protein kinase domain-containing protein n=1 Tax=Botryobasidium botryosum (strain FD-172 SS1) TaxID=930990 RepID=A0A067M9P4_BOTB1|nr:hypothetical protein BOTBODRAFT_176427 [Botryobasidium botryosum FD-172 SS1]